MIEPGLREPEGQIRFVEAAGIESAPTAPKAYGSQLLTTLVGGVRVECKRSSPHVEVDQTSGSESVPCSSLIRL